MLNKKGSRQCIRIEVQGKENRWSAAWLWGWWRRVAAQQAAGSLPWIGVEDPSEEHRLQADHATRVQESAHFQLGGPEKLTGADHPQHALQKKRRLGRLVVHG